MPALSVATAWPNPAAASAAAAAPTDGVEPALALALADGLVELTQSLSDLAFDLGGDPDTLRRHMHSLQAIDRITQAQLAIADVLRSTAPAEQRVAAITLESLSRDLTGKLQAYRDRQAEDSGSITDDP